MNNITMIPIEQLHNHPENPRLDLGDLTELAESIRANGIMQNLTVVRGHMMSKEEWTAAFKAKDKEEATKKKLAKLGKQENMFYGFQRNWSTDEAIMTVQRKVREVKKLWAEAFRLRTDFIRNYTVTNGTGMTTIGKLIARYALTQQNSWSYRLPENHHWNDKYIKETLGIKEDEYEDKRSIWQLAEDNGIPQIRVTIAWINGGGVFDADSSEYGLYYYYDGRYSEDANGQIKERYEFLKEIGYVMSDMEIQLMDGTHECY